MIIKLLNQNADFQEIYEEVYTICLNMERMMEMFSKELAILDRNTVKLMIDEMEEVILIPIGNRFIHLLRGERMNYTV